MLYFNPRSGASKEITFNKDGTIGEGRNNNEWQWRIEENDLIIYRYSGELQNRFRFDKEKERFVCSNEPDAKGIKDHYIVPLERPAK